MVKSDTCFGTDLAFLAVDGAVGAIGAGVAVCAEGVLADGVLAMWLGVR